MEIQENIEGVEGHILYLPGEDRAVFRVYSENKKSFVDYQMTTDDLKIKVLQPISLIRVDDKNGVIDDFPKATLKHSKEKQQEHYQELTKIAGLIQGKE